MARLLIVEDEPLIALSIEDALVSGGFEVVGTAGTVAAALEMLKAAVIDGAVLDINLGGETALPVAAALTARGTPFITVSGYTHEQRPPELAHAELVAKPFLPHELIAAVKRMTRC